MKKMLFTMILALTIVLSLATGASAAESTQIPEAREIHNHNWQFVWSDDYWHCMICSDCNVEKTTTHSKNSEGICKVCGHTPHEHVWQYTPGRNYDYTHGLNCTQCAAISTEDHIYGNDGKCTVCGNSRPHEHQWKWDGNKSNHLWNHFLVCSCGEQTSEPHQLYAWDGKIGNARTHTALCGICGHALLFDHNYDSTYFNGERCTVCGYQPQSASEQENIQVVPIPTETKPTTTELKETTPVETKPAETQPKEPTPIETTSAETQPEDTEPSETQPEDTEPSETQPEDTEPSETQPEETFPKNSTQDDSPRNNSVWIWVAAIIIVFGALGSIIFFVKKKAS